MNAPQEYECVEPVGKMTVQVGEVVEAHETASGWVIPGVTLFPMSSRYFHRHFVPRWS